MNDLGILPVELIVVIFECLDIPSLLAASATCREWRILAQTPSLVYAMLCYRYGVQDGPEGHGWPVPKRIEALKRYHARWNSLRWRKGYTFRTDPGDLWEMFSSVYAQSGIGSSQISFRKAISASAHQHEKQWTIDTDVTIRDFGMDLFQDLAVILGKESQRERSIHLRTMSTGDPHPAAKNPNLSHKLNYVQMGGMATIQVSNDHVGLWCWNEILRPLGIYPAHELVIWNWKTGVVLLHLATNTENVVRGFCFLSDTRVLVTWGVIVYPGVEDAHKKSSLDVYDISQPTISPEKRFLLPPMQHDAVVGDFDIYCDPTPTPNHTVPRPFYTSPDQKICIVTVNFIYQRSGVVLREAINFIFFTSTLLADYPSLEPSEENLPNIIQTPRTASVPRLDSAASLASEPTPPQPIRIAWSQWGDKTRLTMWRMPTSCYTICVSGTRVVRRIQTQAPRRHKIQVCDFNPFAAVDEVQAAMQAKPAVSTQKYIHARQNNVFKNTLFFENPLYGFLPYLEVTTSSTFEMEEVMIDADNIYLVHGRSGMEREIEVLSF